MFFDIDKVVIVAMHQKWMEMSATDPNPNVRKVAKELANNLEQSYPQYGGDWTPSATKNTPWWQRAIRKIVI